MDDQLLATTCSNGNGCKLSSGSIDGSRNCDRLQCRYISAHKKNGVAVIVVMHVNTLGNADEASFALEPGIIFNLPFTKSLAYSAGFIRRFLKTKKPKKKKGH